jgi:hypothetical protein
VEEKTCSRDPYLVTSKRSAVRTAGFTLSRHVWVAAFEFSTQKTSRDLAQCLEASDFDEHRRFAVGIKLLIGHVGYVARDDSVIAVGVVDGQTNNLS